MKCLYVLCAGNAILYRLGISVITRKLEFGCRYGMRSMIRVEGNPPPLHFVYAASI